QARKKQEEQRQTISRSTRAQLQFPVSHVDRFLRQGHYGQRLSSSTPVFLAGVLEYLTAKVLDLAGQEAHSNRKMRITPEHVRKVLEKNRHLYSFFEDKANPPDVKKPKKSKK
uniref:Histone H2A n=1 Tax=Marmota marmota marmota TaxID=9994 RepID=A0A8C5ZAA7_MARMA